MRRLLALLLLVVALPARAETPALPWAKWDSALFDRAAYRKQMIASGPASRKAPLVFVT